MSWFVFQRYFIYGFVQYMHICEVCCYFCLPVLEQLETVLRCVMIIILACCNWLKILIKIELQTTAAP